MKADLPQSGLRESRQADQERRAFFDAMAAWWDDTVPPYEECPFLAEWLHGLALADGHRVLEIGCGTGRLLPYYQGERGDRLVAAVDVSALMLARSRERCLQAGLPARLAQAEAGRLPFPDGTFTHVLIANTFPHLKPFDGVLAECRRVLATGGQVSIVHFASRQHINEVHLDHGGAVAADLLPSAIELAGLLRGLDFSVQTAEDASTHYHINARRD